MHSDTTMNNNGCYGFNPATASAPVRELIKCDSGSAMAGATFLIAGASGATPDDNVRFPGELFITTNAFTLG